MVGGTLYSSLSAIFCTVPRRILPERVFGRRSTTIAVLNEATGPIWSRTSRTASPWITPWSRSTPAFSTSSPSGVCPFRESATPTTAHSATSGWAASTSSICPVESRCPATLITSSVRVIT